MLALKSTIPPSFIVRRKAWILPPCPRAAQVCHLPRSASSLCSVLSIHAGLPLRDSLSKKRFGS